jgi:hypothetical protein
LQSRSILGLWWCCLLLEGEVALLWSIPCHLVKVLFCFSKQVSWVFLWGRSGTFSTYPYQMLAN